MRSGLGELPEDMRFRDVVGLAALGGIGFTVSIFIASLAFTDDDLVSEAKVGILVATVVASLHRGRPTASRAGRRGGRPVGFVV